MGLPSVDSSQSSTASTCVAVNSNVLSGKNKVLLQQDEFLEEKKNSCRAREYARLGRMEDDVVQSVVSVDDRSVCEERRKASGHPRPHYTFIVILM
jgi:hypothetical protein